MQTIHLVELMVREEPLSKEKAFGRSIRGYPHWREMQVKRLNLSLAMGDYDRTRPIYDGRVEIDGVDPICMLLSPEEMFFRAFRHHAFDISELSLSSYSVSVVSGDAHYIAVPVFLSRAFRHTSIYVRKDRGIISPEDLRGRRIGIAEYQLTANVWCRGILEEHYGVKPSDIEWVRGGMDSPGRPEKIKVSLPPDIRIADAPAGATLNQLLEEGKIDGFIGPRAPKCFNDGHPKVGRLFTDSITEAESYYHKTGIFPIMHLLGLRRTLAKRHPWLPGALLKAFTQAKSICEDLLWDTSATKVTMPFVEENLSRAQALLGPQLWSYGLDGKNRATLATFLRYHFEQGLSPRQMEVDELFHPAALESFSI